MAARFIMRLTRSRITVADLVGAPDDGQRYEMLEGDLTVSRSPSRRHQRIIWMWRVCFRCLEEAERREGGLVEGWIKR